MVSSAKPDEQAKASDPGQTLGHDPMGFMQLIDLRFVSIDEILAKGLHGYLTEFLEKVYELGNHVSRDFLLPSAA